MSSDSKIGWRYIQLRWGREVEEVRRWRREVVEVEVVEEEVVVVEAVAARHTWHASHSEITSCTIRSLASHCEIRSSNGPLYGENENCWVSTMWSSNSEFTWRGKSGR